MKNNKKSPIKAKPLRYAGQSLSEEIDRLCYEHALKYFLYSIICIIIAGSEWWRYFKNPPPAPIFYSIIAVLVVIYSVYKSKKSLKRIRSIRLGMEGEKAVGQYLECLREKGYRVFHDILGDDFNLDHVVVSTKGIFVVETKTYSKPMKGQPKIVFDGEKLSIDGVGRQVKQVVQVQAATKWLKEVLLESTGKEYFVQPVILFPGWYVESTKEGKESGVWVLNPKALPIFIENRTAILSQEDMMLASFHISQFIRSKEAMR